MLYISKLKKFLPVFCSVVLMVSSNALCSQAEPDQATEIQWLTALKNGDVEKVTHILDQFPNFLNKLIFYCRVRGHVTPLGLAAVLNHLQLAQFLLSRGAHINQNQYQQTSSLHLACMSHLSSADMVTLLIRNGANIHALTTYRDTPLHWCRDRARAHLLVQNGADITVKNLSEFQPIYVAASDNYPHLVSYYLSIRPDLLDARTRLQKTPLNLVATYNSTESAVVLLQAGADVNAQDQFGRTPLYMACKENCDTFVKFLLCWDPDLHREDNDDKKRKPLRIATEHIQRLYHNYMSTPTHREAYRRATTTVQALLEYGTPVEPDNAELLNALKTADFNPKQIILDARAQTNAKLYNKLNECGIQALPRDLEKLILAFAATPELPTEKRKSKKARE